ncbi:hypothetical protein QYF61_003063, partial [Mycteria americana]
MKPWSGFPREVVGSLCLEVFKTCVATAQSTTVTSPSRDARSSPGRDSIASGKYSKGFQRCNSSQKGTLLTHNALSINQHAQIPFCRAALQSFLSQFILMSGVPLSQVQKLSFVVKFHAIDDCPVLQFMYIPLQGLLSLKRVNSTSQFSIISKLTNGAFNACLQVIDK